MKLTLQNLRKLSFESRKMSQFTKMSSKLAQVSKLCSCNNSVPKSSLIEFSNLGSKGHCGFASLTRIEQDIVTLTSPAHLIDQLGTDKYFAETDGSSITAVAATRKLLSEERLRRETNRLQVPIDQILKATNRRNLSPLMIKILKADL